jgi:hypothetical protein
MTHWIRMTALARLFHSTRSGLDRIIGTVKSWQTYLVLKDCFVIQLFFSTSTKLRREMYFTVCSKFALVMHAQTIPFFHWDVLVMWNCIHRGPFCT